MLGFYKNSDSNKYAVQFLALFFLFAFTYIWWYNTAVLSWIIPFFSLVNLIIFLVAAAISSFLILDTNNELVAGSESGSGKKSINLSSIKKLSAAFLVFFVVAFRLLASSTNNTGAGETLSYNYDGFYRKTENRMTVILLDDINLNSVVNFASNGDLPNFSRIIGNSGVGILKTEKPGRSHNPLQLLNRSLRLPLSNKETSNKIPMNFRELDVKPEFGLTDFLLSLLFLQDSGKSLKERQNEIEPVWDTAERFGYKTGLISMPEAQKITGGFYISEQYFKSEGDEDIDKDRSNEIFLSETSGERPDLTINSDITIKNFSVNLTDRANSGFLNAADRICNMGFGLYEEFRPDITFIRLSTQNFVQQNENILGLTVYSVFDAFVGFWRQKTVKTHDRFIVIGITNDIEKDSFILYSIPNRQYNEKTFTVNYEKIHSDLLYLIGIPLILKKSPDINRQIYHPSSLSSNPPGFTRYYPPYKNRNIVSSN